MEIEGGAGYPRRRAFWICPPGRVPLEAQREVLHAEPWGAPLYVKGVGRAEAVEEVRVAVSPWLWVLSLAGFGLAIVNTRRISRMFRGWRRRKWS